MTKKTNTRDYTLTEKRMVRHLDAAKHRTRRPDEQQSIEQWPYLRVPLIELVPALPSILAQVMVI